MLWDTSYNCYRNVMLRTVKEDLGTRDIYNKNTKNSEQIAGDTEQILLTEVKTVGVRNSFEHGFTRTYMQFDKESS